MASRATPRVRVVVLNWNSAWFTRRCLLALAETDYPPEALEVVLVDNASIDGSLEQLREEFPEVRVVANEANLGFAEGCNRAMRDLEGVDHVALVNNDAVPEPGWLRPLVDAIETDPSAGAAAAMLVLEPAFTRAELCVAGGSARLDSVTLGGVEVLDRCLSEGLRSVGRADWPMTLDHHVDGRATLLMPAGSGAKILSVTASGEGTLTIDTEADSASLVLGLEPVCVELSAGDDREERLNGLGTDLNEVGEGIDRLYGEPLGAAEGEHGHVRGFCGGGVLLRSSMLADVGLFDPTFFAYYEDTDLAWRARNAGYRTVVVADSVIRHAFGGSGGSKARGFFFLNYRNWLLSVLRNGDRELRRRALGRVWERLRWAIRANVLSPLKHRRKPDWLLVGEWLRVLAGAAAGRAAQLGRRIPTARRLPGELPATRVRSRLQPTGADRPPASRAGGPLLVYVELSSTGLSSTDLSSTGLDGESQSAATLLRGLSRTHSRIEAVAVVQSTSAASGYRRASPQEWARMLGHDPAESLAVTATDLDLDELDPLAVLVVGDHRNGTAPANRVRAAICISSLMDGESGMDPVEAAGVELLTRYDTP